MSDDNIISAVARYYSDYFCNNLYAIAKNHQNKNLAIAYQSTVKDYINSISNDNTYKIINTDLKNIAKLEIVENDTRIMSSENKVFSLIHTILSVSGGNLQGKNQNEIIYTGLKFMIDVLTYFGTTVINQGYVLKIVDSRTKEDGIEVEKLFKTSFRVNQIQFNTGNSMDGDRKIDVVNIKIIQEITEKYNELRIKYNKLNEKYKESVEIVKLLANQNKSLKNELNEKIAYNDEYNEPDDVSEITFSLNPIEETPTEFTEKYETQFDDLERKLDNIVVAKQIETKEDEEMSIPIDIEDDDKTVITVTASVFDDE